MLAADWLRLSCRVDGVGQGGGGEGMGQARITHISLPLSLLSSLMGLGGGGGRRGGEGTGTHISLSPILSDDILDFMYLRRSLWLFRNPP